MRPDQRNNPNNAAKTRKIPIIGDGVAYRMWQARLSKSLKPGMQQGDGVNSRVLTEVVM